MFRPQLLLLATAGLWAQAPRWTYPLPAEDRVEIRPDIDYRVDGTAHVKLDLYRPAGASGKLPVVLFANGIGSPDLRKFVQYTSWGRLVAGNGLAAIAFDTHDKDIPGDLTFLITFLQSHDSDFGIDMTNVVVFSVSANVRAVLHFANQPRPYIKGAVVYYGVADVPSFRLDLPVFFVRAAFDTPSLNRGIDRMLTQVMTANAPWTITNLPAHHGFEIADDTPLAHETISRTLDFMKSVTRPGMQHAIASSVMESSASAAVLAQNWTAAIAAYRQILRDQPQNSEAHRQLGQALIEQRQFEPALASLEKALALNNPNRGLIAMFAAICSIQLDRKQDALRWLTQVPATPGMIDAIRTQHAFDAIRSDPQFPAAIR